MKTKTQEMLVWGASALALYLVWRSMNKASATPGAAPSQWTGQIFDVGGKAFGNGWSYYDDGTAIDPAGNYFKDGAMIWKAH